MVSKKVSEGVGKKIVEALKKQSEIEITPISSRDEQNIETSSLNDELEKAFPTENEELQESVDQNDFLSELDKDDLGELAEEEHSEGSFISEQELSLEQPSPAIGKTFINYQQPVQPVQDNFIAELDNFEIPSNIAVLKKLISQLPSGVTKHTGAQIIKQTMEALGISMKSVLQEAQQVQDGLNNSAKECFATIQEYKKQIHTLEKQAQSHQKQYSALNDLISLFIQTGV